MGSGWESTNTKIKREETGEDNLFQYTSSWYTLFIGQFWQLTSSPYCVSHYQSSPRQPTQITCVILMNTRYNVFYWLFRWRSARSWKNLTVFWAWLRDIQGKGTFVIMPPVFTKVLSFNSAQAWIVFSQLIYG